MGNAVSASFEQLKKELLDAIKNKQTASVTLLTTFQQEGERVLLRQDILASLRFDEIHARSSRIVQPNLCTYEWIFEKDPARKQKVKYMRWLEDEHGVYWVTGKAGSGKSTLMKHISMHKDTQKALERWSNGRRLLVASYYFWCLGTPMQKSYEGLLQSILYDILRQCPDLIQAVCDDRWMDVTTGRYRNTIPWTLPELRACIEKLIDSKLESGQTLCFCLFIDGLDEYEGDPEEVVHLVSRLAQADNIKVCASSRPWEVFKQSFPLSTITNNTLVLHDHTSKDIAKVVHQELDRFVASRPAEAEEMQKLVADVIKKAQGVFLWVILVIKKELLQGFRYADSIMSLRERLNNVPAGMC